MSSKCQNSYFKISRFFGITSPKYYREIQEFKKMQIEEAERKKEEAENTSGWTNIGNSPSEVITELDASKLTASNLYTTAAFWL